MKRSRPELLAPPPIPPWRWIALLSVVVSFAHGQLHVRSGGPTLEVVVTGSGGALLPASSVFSVWTVIHLLLFGYAVAQLGEHQRRVAAYDHVSMLVVLASLVASLQLTTLAFQDLVVTSAVCLLLAAVAGSAYAVIHREVSAGRASAWVGLPFALLLAWSGVMAAASLEGAIAVAGCPSAAPATVLLSAMGGTAVYFGLRYRDLVLPAAAAWLVLGFCAANPAASSAFVVAGVCATTAVIIGATRLSVEVDRRRPRF